MINQIQHSCFVAKMQTTNHCHTTRLKTRRSTQQSRVVCPVRSVGCFWWTLGILAPIPWLCSGKKMLALCWHTCCIWMCQMYPGNSSDSSSFARNFMGNIWIALKNQGSLAPGLGMVQMWGISNIPRSGGPQSYSKILVDLVGLWHQFQNR